MLYCMRINAKLINSLFLVKVNILGLEEINSLVEHSQKICFVANHTSLLDISTILLKFNAFKIGFVSKKSLFSIPVFRTYLKITNSVPIKRNDMRSNIYAIKKSVENINNGIPMLIFPEGTRSKTGEVLPFKNGSFKIAERSGAILIPLAISGLRKYFEGREKIFEKGNSAFIKVLKPIDYSRVDSKDFDLVQKQIEEEIRKEVENEG